MRAFILYITLIVALLARPVFSQSGSDVPDTVVSLPGIEIETSVDLAEIYIGDLVNYKISIKYDSTYELIPPPFGANLGAFDVKDYQSDVLTRLPDGRFQSDNNFVLSTFTTGNYVIPPIPVIFNLPDGSRKALLSEGVPIKVLSLLGNAEDSVDIKPLKAQHEFERDLLRYYIYGGALALLLIIIVVLVWLKLRKRRDELEPLDLRPAWEVAFERLAFLKQKNLPQEGKFKEYYTELTETLRTYFERMHRINALDMTTEEFLSILGEIELPAGLYESTEKLLTHADLVKFAKLIPAIEKTEQDFDDTHRVVEEVRADYDRQLRPQLTVSQTSGTSGSPPAAEEVTS